MSHPDPTVPQLFSLSSRIQGFAWHFVNIARQNGLPVQITEGRRSYARQFQLRAQGRSLTMASRHITGNAFDIDLYHWNPDLVPQPYWDWLGALGEHLGLRWGGRWRNLRDFRHFER